MGKSLTRGTSRKGTASSRGAPRPGPVVDRGVPAGQPRGPGPAVSAAGCVAPAEGI